MYYNKFNIKLSLDVKNQSNLAIIFWKFEAPQCAKDKTQ